MTQFTSFNTLSLELNIAGDVLVSWRVGSVNFIDVFFSFGLYLIVQRILNQHFPQTRRENTGTGL